MTEQTDRQRRIDENLAALGATFASMNETDAQIRALLVEQREGLSRASQALDEVSAGLDRIEQSRADEEE